MQRCTCMLNLRQPFEASTNYHLSAISSTSNLKICQFHTQLNGLSAVYMHVACCQSWHIERWLKDVGHAQNTKAGVITSWVPRDPL